MTTLRWLHWVERRPLWRLTLMERTPDRTWMQIDTIDIWDAGNKLEAEAYLLQRAADRDRAERRVLVDA